MGRDRLLSLATRIVVQFSNQVVQNRDSIALFPLPSHLAPPRPIHRDGVLRNTDLSLVFLEIALALAAWSTDSSLCSAASRR